MKKINLYSIRSFWKMLLCGIIVTSLSSFSCPAYAGRAALLRDVDRDESVLPTGRFHGAIGGVLGNDGDIFNGTRRTSIGLPLFILKYEDWAFLSSNGAHVWLYHPDRTFKLGGGVSRHPGNPIIEGITRRKPSLDANVNTFLMTSIAHFELSYSRDIGNVSHGDSATLRIARVFLFNQVLFNHELLLIPGVNVEWENDRLVDYYYGVRPEEAALSRPAYVGRDAVSVRANLIGMYRINRSWALMGEIHAKHFGAGIAQSPLVSDHNAIGGFLGAFWIF